MPASLPPAAVDRPRPCAASVHEEGSALDHRDRDPTVERRMLVHRPTPASSAVKPGLRARRESGGRSGRPTDGSTAAIGVTSKPRNICAFASGGPSCTTRPRERRDLIRIDGGRGRELQQAFRRHLDAQISNRGFRSVNTASQPSDQPRDLPDRSGGGVRVSSRLRGDQQHLEGPQPADDGPVQQQAVLERHPALVRGRLAGDELRRSRPKYDDGHNRRHEAPQPGNHLRTPPEGRSAPIAAADGRWSIRTVGCRSGSRRTRSRDPPRGS